MHQVKKHSHTESCHHHHGHHHHSHSHSGMKKAFWLNLVFAVIELVGGAMVGSLAVMSDAVHDFGDAIIIGGAYFLENFSHKKSDDVYSYGYRRYSAVSALIAGTILFAGTLGVLWVSVPRLLHPEQIPAPHTGGMFLLALLGMAVNGWAAWGIQHESKSMNHRMILLHLLEDLLGWVSVLIGALLIHFFQWNFIDPLLATMLALWIGYNAFKNLKFVFDVLLQKVPSHISMPEVISQIQSINGVVGVHHCHLWSIDGEKHILTAHIVIGSGLEPIQIDSLRAQIKNKVQEWGIFEATLEVEHSDSICVDPSHDPQ